MCIGVVHVLEVHVENEAENEKRREVEKADATEREKKVLRIEIHTYSGIEIWEHIRW